jgi:hypothetical protein
MTCSEVEKALPEILEGTADNGFQSAFEVHLKSCTGCSELVSDLKSISNEAKKLAESDEPPAYLWHQIAQKLRAEGVIREEAQPTWKPVLVPARPARRWNAWWLAPVVACLVAAGGYVIAHHPTEQVARNSSNQPAVATAPTAGSNTGATTLASVPKTSDTIAVPKKPATQSVARKTNPGDVVASAKVPKTEQEDSVEAGSAAEDQQFLSVVSTRAPSMRATVESQLQAVNEDIRQVQEYLARNPSDVDARQQLMDAYQKKALLYQIALDRIQ